ncbi:DUF3750 domain-containing protein [Thioalkalivibrio sp. HK1]|uniref:DUF3750 domain-containing protein n=1 Tax=Thioalkalivibrio sp. HK1 TaxID=1469245 RepID=UPI0004725B47|nr:DUF3750 domain-containing protein [Thioalkalivibrio sp. HK1]
MRKGIGRTLSLFCIILLGPLLSASCSSVRLGQDWRNADRSSAGIVPDPSETNDAIVQVWAARVFNWRGLLAVHTWIATKPEGALHYDVHHVIGWRGRYGRSVVVSGPDLPDRKWFGQPPIMLHELRGERAAKAIPDIIQAVDDYPWDHDYRTWPGPNSNTFTAFVVRRTRGLDLELPSTAIGKDYLGEGKLLARPPGGRGWQFSLFGLFGGIAGIEEGLEINILGLVFGIDPIRPAIKLPGIGRIGSGASGV